MDTQISSQNRFAAHISEYRSITCRQRTGPLCQAIHERVYFYMDTCIYEQYHNIDMLHTPVYTGVLCVDTKEPDLCASPFTKMYKFTHVYVCAYKYLYICIYVNVYTYMYVCTYIYV